MGAALQGGTPWWMCVPAARIEGLAPTSSRPPLWLLFLPGEAGGPGGILRSRCSWAGSASVGHDLLHLARLL